MKDAGALAWDLAAALTERDRIEPTHWRDDDTDWQISREGMIYIELFLKRIMKESIESFTINMMQKIKDAQMPIQDEKLKSVQGVFADFVKQ